MRKFLLGVVFLALSTIQISHAQGIIPRPGGAPNFKTSVASPATLPATGNNQGDVRVSLSDNTLYEWDGAAWGPISGGGGGSVSSVFGRTGAVVSANGDYTATQITNTPAGGISAITAQAALNELDTEKQNLLVNSAGLAAALSDETGTGLSVFNSSPTFTGTANFNALHMPQTVSPAVSIFMNDTDTGEGSDGDGIIYWSANGVERLRLTAASFSSTLPISAPDFVYPSQAQGLFLASPQVGAGVPTFRAIGTAEITSNQIAFPFTIPNSATETDPNILSDGDTGLAFPSDGLFNTVNNAVVTMRWAPGLVESVVDFLAPTATITGNLTVGTINGVAYPPPAPTGTANHLAVFDSGGNLAAHPDVTYDDTATDAHLVYASKNLSVSNNAQGFIFDASGTVGGDLTLARLNSQADVTGGFYGNDIVSSGNVGSANMFRANSSGAIANDYTSIVSNNSASVGGNYQVSNITNSGNIVGNYFGNNSGNTGTVGGDFHVLSSSNSGSVGVNYNGVNLQNAADVAGNLNMLDLSNLSGHTVAGGTQFFHITSDSDVTGNEVLANIHTSAVVGGNKQGIVLQVQGSATNVEAMSISVNGATSPNQKYALNLNGGSFTANYAVDTSEYTVNPFGSIHNLGGQFTVASGSPLLATPVFMGNFGFQIAFEDDATADNFLGAGDSLGQSIMAFVNQVAGASGKTMDTLNYVLLGGSNTDANTGHINEVNIFRGLGLENAGGGLTVGTQRMFYVDPGFDGALGTTKFGFINASNTNNWMKGTLVLGGTTGTPSGAFALDVSGTANISGTLDVGGVATLGNGSNVVTQAALDNSLNIANTAYVDAAVAAGSTGITALTGDGTATGPGSAAFTLATVNGNVGSFGSATNVSTFTVNAKGLITAAGTTAIQIAESQVTNLVSDLAGKQATLTIGNLTDAGTDGITVTGGTGAVIGTGTSFSQHVADATHNGYLSAADFVAFSAAGAAPASSNITGNTTLAYATARNYFGDTTGGTFTATLPAAASNDGKDFYVMNVTFGGSNNISVARTGSDLINGATSDTITPGEVKHYASNGTNWFVMN